MDTFTDEETDLRRTPRLTKVLIVGAGPAGASAAAFLGKHGIQTVMISRHSGTADTPRAHITNQRTMEALRDAGRSEEHTSELQSRPKISYAVFCLKKIFF